MEIDTQLLGGGWYQMEFQPDTRSVWSTDLAFLETGNCEFIDLEFSTNASDLTGNPQNIVISSDESILFSANLAKGFHQVKLHCKDASTLRIKVDSFCPAQYIQGADRRVLGINLSRLQGNGAPVSRARATTQIENLRSDLAPITIQVEVSTACHLSCVMCSRSEKSGGPSQHMPLEIWERLLEGARRSKSVNFLGLGEPWTHPHFLDFLASLDRYGVQQSVITTGDLIDEKRASFLGQLKHLRDLTFSIDSPDPDVYFKTRGTKLERTTAGLDRAVNAITKPEVVRIHAVVMRDNLESLQGFPEFLARHSVKRLVMRGVIQISAATRDMVPDYSDHERELIRSVARRAEASGIDVNLLPSLPDDLLQINALDVQQERNPHTFNAVEKNKSQESSGPAKVCLDPWEKAIVTRDGEVFPCECYHLQESVGSLAQQTFSEIWHGAAYREIRRGLLRNENLGCRSCERRTWGTHPLNEFCAEAVSLQGRPGEDCQILMRNVGLADWCSESPLRLGTAGPRDRHGSAFEDVSWFAENRVSEHIEQTVRPGEIGTFRFRLKSPSSMVEPEIFQFLVEGHCWLPGTQYEVSQDNMRGLAMPQSVPSQQVN